jgi:hypothetical protein
MDDDDVFGISFVIIYKLFYRDAAEIHVYLRFRQKNRVVVYPAFSIAAIEPFLIYRNLVIGSQLIQDQKSHIVPAELIATARISQPEDQLQ